MMAGHHGMVGSDIVRALEAQGLAKILVRTHAQLDLTKQLAVQDYNQEKQTNISGCS